ncbi:MAG: CopG family transcriptional regulator [Bacteroidetes bacterium]|nr:MAG: CopG family transcriptional regulator [Bacteroidota bacterium]
MATFTSSLPDSLLELLGQKAKELSVPKNKLIERALVIYLDQLKRAEYVRSFKKLTEDADILNIAEEGMEDYLTDIDNFER